MTFTEVTKQNELRRWLMSECKLKIYTCPEHNLMQEEFIESKILYVEYCLGILKKKLQNVGGSPDTHTHHLNTIHSKKKRIEKERATKNFYII